MSTKVNDRFINRFFFFRVFFCKKYSLKLSNDMEYNIKDMYMEVIQSEEHAYW